MDEIFGLLKTLTGKKGEWLKLNEKEGIKVWSMQKEGSDIIAMRGQTEIPASAAQIATLFSDCKTQLRWIDLLIISEELEEIDPLHKIIYQVVKPPFPVDKREFVYRAKWSVSPGEQRALYTTESCEHASAPKRVGVRGTIHSGGTTLEQLSDDRCLVTTEVQTDPNGNLPKAVVNLIQMNWPYLTLKNLREQVRRDNPTPYEPLQEAMSNA